VGIENLTGQNNCFLNCVVQVLYTIEAFKERFLNSNQSSQVGSELQVLFRKIDDYSNQMKDPNLHHPPERISTSHLRNALGYDHNTMDDAVDCIERILNAVDQTSIGQRVIEQQACSSCAKNKKSDTFNELIHYLPSTSLNAALSSSASIGLSFSTLVKHATNTSIHDSIAVQPCPVNPSTCPGTRKQLKRRVLSNSPDAYCLALAWEQNPDKRTVERVVSAISSSLNLDELYHTTLDPTAMKQLNLTGLICYYGLHYVAYVYNKDSGSWKFVDDNKVIDVGKNLTTVKEKLASSGYRPTLLVFSNPLFKKIGGNNAYKIDIKSQNFGHERSFYISNTSQQQDNLAHLKQKLIHTTEQLNNYGTSQALQSLSELNSIKSEIENEFHASEFNNSTVDLDALFYLREEVERFAGIAKELIKNPNQSESNSKHRQTSRKASINLLGEEHQAVDPLVDEIRQLYMENPVKPYFQEAIMCSNRTNNSLENSKDDRPKRRPESKSVKDFDEINQKAKIKLQKSLEMKRKVESSNRVLISEKHVMAKSSSKSSSSSIADPIYYATSSSSSNGKNQITTHQTSKNRHISVTKNSPTTRRRAVKDLQLPPKLHHSLDRPNSRPVSRQGRDQNKNSGRKPSNRSLSKRRLMSTNDETSSVFSIFRTSKWVAPRRSSSEEGRLSDEKIDHREVQLKPPLTKISQRNEPEKLEFANKTSENIYLQNKPKPISKKLEAKSLIDIAGNTCILSVDKTKPPIPTKKRSLKKNLEVSKSASNLLDNIGNSSSESGVLSRETSTDHARNTSHESSPSHSSKDDSGHGEGSSESGEEINLKEAQKPKPGGSGMMKWKCTHKKNVRISNTDRTLPVKI